jgi:hypothetical protein
MMVPDDGVSAPDKILMRVDFPAPFSPHIQRISPRLSVTLTSFSASTFPKFLKGH